jgi:hypothetical protein
MPGRLQDALASLQGLPAFRNCSDLRAIAIAAGDTSSMLTSKANCLGTVMFTQAIAFRQVPARECSKTVV